MIHITRDITDSAIAQGIPQLFLEETESVEDFRVVLILSMQIQERQLMRILCKTYPLQIFDECYGNEEEFFRQCSLTVSHTSYLFEPKKYSARSLKQGESFIVAHFTELQLRYIGNVVRDMLMEVDVL
jgi:hypothetical protein